MTRRLGILSLFTLLLAGVAAAEKPAAIELGFKPEKVYSYGNLDNVNVFNGNLIFTIPLGMEYAVNGNLSYGLTLVYNSKAWDYYYVENFYDPSDVRAWAKPNIRSNAGMGWRVSLGRLIPPTEYTSTSGYDEVDSDYWTYESPSGEEHTLDVRGSTATVSLSSDGGREYLDSASLRMVVASSTSRLIQFPNGDVHTFTYVQNAWRLTKMVDAFNNAVNVAYTYDTSGRTTAWTLSDVYARQHTISFINSPYMSETHDRGQIVSSITMRGYGPSGTNVTYTFNYESAASVAYGCEHNLGPNTPGFSPTPTTTRATVPLLTSISLPDGSNWAFNYYYDSSTSGDCASGLLKEVTLPTLGKMSYTYQTYRIPSNDWCAEDGPSNTSAGVRTRTVDGQTWTYVQTTGPVAQTYGTPGYLYTCGEPPIDGEQDPGYPKPLRRWKRTSVIAPAHTGSTRTRTDHYFSIFRTKNFEDDPLLDADQKPVFEYGAPASAAWSGASAAKLTPVEYETAADVSAADVPGDPGTRYLYEQIWSGCTTAGDCSTATLLQSKYSRSAQFGGYRMTSSERTVFDTDTGCTGAKCYVQTDSSDHNGAGRLRQVVQSSNFRGDTQVTERTEYAGWTNTEVYNSGLKWITGKYTERKRTIGARTTRTLYQFGGFGELLRTRSLVNPAAESPNDVIESYTYLSNGNLTSIRTYGGDHAAQALPTGIALGSVDLTTRTPQYRTDYSWSYGGLTREWPIDPATGSALLFNTRDYTRNAGSGLVTASKATDGLATAYTYTTWGAVASVTPPGELQTTYTYSPATTLAKARVTMTRGDATVVYEYDTMGRLAREEKTLPGAGCVQRRLTYDAFSRLSTETAWHGCSATSPGSTTFRYDAFGRNVSVHTPDGKFSNTDYTGSRIVKRSSTVAQVTGEATVVKSEEYDGFGRLIEVKENVHGTTSQLTTYAYDAADRLTNVTMGTQTRVFTYDGRGFLTSEQHPELGVNGNGTTRYREYDARGHAWRRTTGTDNGVFDVRFVYDPAERVTLMTRAGDGRKLKEFLYDDPAGTICGGQICRGKLAAAARYHWDADLSDVTNSESLAVTESYKYDPATGRPGRLDRAIGTTSLFTGNSFYTQLTYNNLGAVASVWYPCSDVAGCPGGVQRVVQNAYTNGVLTAVGNYASMITYAPSGIIAKVTHGGSGAAGSEVWAADPSGMARPLSITAKSPSSATYWTSGNYAYDGAGNVKNMGSMSYAHDPLYRLVRWTQNNADGSTTWNGREYDRYGNPLYATSGSCLTGGTGCTSTNGTPRAITGTTNHFTDTAYDAAGNVTGDPAGRTFTYDGVNVLTRASVAGRNFRYLYTVDDERIAVVELVSVSRRKTTYTIRGLDKQLLSVWQTDPVSNVASWVEDEIRRGSSLVARESATRGTTHYFLDHLGSPRAITNASGTLLGLQSFDPWGNGGTADGGALQFTAHERDGALYGAGSTAFPDYMHARYYDVVGGRFLAVDPGNDWDPAQPQSWNLYGYVRNNPMNAVDRDGRAINFIGGALLGAVENVAFQVAINHLTDRPLTEGVGTQALIGAGVGATGVGVAVLAQRGMNLYRTAKVGKLLEQAAFAQRKYSPVFGAGGKFAGRTVDDVASALKSGTMPVKDVPVDYIVRDGKALILNTRSAKALEQAGIPRSQWTAVNRTGDKAYEARLTAQLQRNKLTNEGISDATRSAGGQ